VERLKYILFFAGLACFALAGVLSGVLPLTHLSRIPYRTLDQLITEPSQEFLDLARRYPEQMKQHYGQADAAAFRQALRLGRDTYIAEACWHCHSQYIRPVSNEDVRFGKVSWAAEYMNEMFLPHLFGTRRVGPDLIREAGRHSNDWHAAHFYDPPIVVPTTVMPRYPWFFDGEKPNKKGLAMIAYVQWLGSWATPEALAREEKHHGPR
jgi:cytochrome c oxidase cbb3-type subunit II